MFYTYCSLYILVFFIEGFYPNGKEQVCKTCGKPQLVQFQQNLIQMRGMFLKFIMFCYKHHVCFLEFFFKVLYGLVVYSVTAYILIEIVGTYFALPHEILLYIYKEYLLDLPIRQWKIACCIFDVFIIIWTYINWHIRFNHREIFTKEYHYKLNQFNLILILLAFFILYHIYLV